MQITAHDFILSPSDERAIRDAAAKLDDFAPRILSCRVAIEVPRSRGRSGRQYRGHIKLDVPGQEIVVRRRSYEAIPTAVQQAFKAVSRREIYFDRRSVLNGAFDDLQEGAEVRYVEEPGEQRPQASTVVIHGHR